MQNTTPSTPGYADDEPLLEQKQLAKNSTLSTSEIEKAIQLSLRLKRKVIQSSSFAEQTFPMLVSLTVDNLPSSDKVPIDLVCVIDHSGSMSGQKIQLVKTTFKYLLKYLSDQDRLSIVIFDDKASRITPLLRTTEENKSKILSAVNNISACGGTDISLGMNHAFQVLKERRYTNPVTSIFLLSDGLDNKAQVRVKESLAKFEGLNDISINTFGFGTDHDPQLMTDIADLRDGNFYAIRELEMVDQTFIDCLGGILSTVTQNVQIKIKPEQSDILKGVEIVRAYGDATMWAREGEIYITKLGGLISGVQKDFVLELKIPANTKELQDQEKNFKIASAEADITALDNTIIKKQSELRITLINEVEEFKQEEEDDREVMINFFRVKGALVMADAKKLADQNKNEDAKKMLENYKEELGNCFLNEEQSIKNLVKDIEQTIQNVSPVIYAKKGKHALMSNMRAQLRQKTNFDSADYFGNQRQSDMLADLKLQKESS